VVQALRHLDHDGSGSITDRELAHGMLTLNVRLSKAEVKAVVAAFDANENGKVDLKELAKALDKYRLNGTVPQSAKQQRRAAQAALESLAHKLVSQKLSVQTVLKKLDEKKTGTLGPQELRRGLEQLGVSLSDREFSALSLHFDPKSEGCIDYAEFCRTITAAVASITEVSQAAQTWTKEKEEAVRRVFDSLIALMAERHETILRMMRRLDRSENGVLSGTELQHGLGTLGIRLQEEETAILVRIFDRDGSGNVDYAELHKAVTRYRTDQRIPCPPGMTEAKTPRPKDPVLAAVIARLATELKPHKGVLLTLLERLDRKRVGFVGANEVQRVFKSLNCPIAASECEALVKAFDSNGQGVICYCDLVQAIQAHVPTTAANAKIIRPWWEDDEYIVSVIERFKVALRPRAADLQSRLEGADKRGAGVLKPLKLHSLLVHSFGIQVHEGDLGVLWKVFDQNRDGLVNYMELLNVIRFHEAHVKAAAQSLNTPEAPDPVDEWWMSDKVLCMVIERISGQLKGDNSALFQMLVKLDKNKNGLISPTEMHRGLITLGVKLHEGDLGAVVRIFDRNSKNEIDYMELYRVLVQWRARRNARAVATGPASAQVAPDDYRTVEAVLERILREMKASTLGWCRLFAISTMTAADRLPIASWPMVC
jgi:Ca2+-binding EF-hand superfamily protein